jgi:hypothetical protein
MIYTVNEIENIFDLIVYTVSAMKKCGCEECDINDYISDSLKEKYNYNIVELSKEYLEECNTLPSKSKDQWFEDTWRDHYYASMWDDDGRYDNADGINDEVDTYDYLTGNSLWNNTNTVDSIEDINDDEEAYEGFDSCKNHYWDSFDDCNDNDIDV